MKINKTSQTSASLHWQQTSVIKAPLRCFWRDAATLDRGLMTLPAGIALKLSAEMEPVQRT